MKKDSNLIMGINTIKETVLACPDKIIEVFVLRKDLAKDSLTPLLQKNNVRFSYVEKKKLESLTGSDSHQGFVAKVHRHYLSLKEILVKNPSKLVMLDQIYDPHNFGAILRAAECFGIEGVIYSKNKGCPVTPVVAKVASGATELLPLVRVSNLSDSLIKLKDEGYQVVIADCSDKAEDLKTFTFPEKAVLLLGSEEKGVSPIVRKKADIFLRIPMKGKLDSLNVSQAAACFFSYF